MSIYGASEVFSKDWFWSESFGHWQKRNDRVYVYITPIMGGFKAQLYLTGTTSFCELEVQTNSSGEAGLIKMVVFADRWLKQFADGDLYRIHKDLFSISNPEGVWVKDYNKKGWCV